MIQERLAALRHIMQRESWDAVVIPGSDPHSSEYLPARWQQRQFISGFTGSYGTFIITPSHAGLWTDTRYFIQFDKELGGTEYVLHKLRVPEAVQPWEWLGEALPQEAGEILEKLYPGYAFVECNLHFSDWTGGVYIEALMRRKQKTATG